ncbi:hypothetical protein D3877_10680 [Azospirillum cavernae]|uniref:Uncharacterized protein n=1 Tax=Azospirillum cavernae TaxID=2320860 RepID=A0A418W4J2_9PROT|nr:hypothetical protein [Azospirillum cavernae]RJF84925.1 hypothetical protein D3877_10680 [Azospirillum cavernae]
MTRVGLMVGAGLLVLCGAAQAQQGRATVDPALCRALTRHQPAPDVAYKPGVDVKGRAVAPADLPGSAGSSLSTERFEIPLTLDLARRLGVKLPTAGLPTAGLPGAMEIGRMTLDGGRLLLNGQPLGGASEAELVALCRGR